MLRRSNIPIKALLGMNSSRSFCSRGSSCSLLMRRVASRGLNCGPQECAMMTSLAATFAASPMRQYHTTSVMRAPKQDDTLAAYHEMDKYREEEKKDEQQEEPFNADPGVGYLPFPAPFHTINVVMLLFLANILMYFAMLLGSEDTQDFIVEHFTLSHENYHKIYPLFTSALYQENALQLAIDCWLLWQFGNTMLGFLGNPRMTLFWAMCSVGGGLIHVARQKFELHYGMDEIEVRGRCYGPNPFILGLVGVEGLIFRHLNFIQQPPVPFLVLTAFVMVIDVWRIFTTKPEEHGASTGGALVAYLFWLLPTRFLGLDKLTAKL